MQAAKGLGGWRGGGDCTLQRCGDRNCSVLELSRLLSTSRRVLHAGRSSLFANNSSWSPRCGEWGWLAFP